MEHRDFDGREWTFLISRMWKGEGRIEKDDMVVVVLCVPSYAREIPT